MDIIEKIFKFQSAIDNLKNEGLKMKDISEILEVQSSVLSGLYRTVFPYVINNKYDECESDLIANGFSYVNNISKEKTIKNLDGFINKLNDHNVNTSIFTDKYNEFNEAMKAHIKRSTDTCLEGFYHCYSHSSNFNRIKKEPFLISKCKKSYFVKKGNTKSNIAFEGVLFVIGKQSIYINMIDNFDRIEENQTMILNRPFVKYPDFIRGVYLGLNYLKQPVGRRMVLRRVSDTINMEHYNNVETEYLNKEPDCDDVENDIIEYLSDRDDIIECLSVPFPSLDTKELLMEKDMLKQYKKKEMELKGVV